MGNMNGVSTKEDLNIIPLGSYIFLIGMDWLDKHRVVLDCYNKDFTCLDEEENSRIVRRKFQDLYLLEIFQYCS